MAPPPLTAPDLDEAPHESWYVPSGDRERFAAALTPEGLPSLRLILYRDGTGEVVLRLCEDASGLLVGPTDRRLPGVGVYVSQLRGEYYHQVACRAGDFSPGAPVALVREPDNEHDPFAVAVYDATRTHKAAYINKQKAQMLSRILDAAGPLDSVSLRGTAAGRACEQIAVLAARPDVLRRLLSPRPSDLPPPAPER